MDIKNLKNYDGEEVDVETMEKIEESENVVEVENCGMSGQHVGYIYYNVKLKDGSEISIYCK